MDIMENTQRNYEVCSIFLAYSNCIKTKLGRSGGSSQIVEWDKEMSFITMTDKTSSLFERTRDPIRKQKTYIC
jgi:hypothetical protein